MSNIFTLGDDEDPNTCVVQPLFWTSCSKIASTSRRVLTARFYLDLQNISELKKSGCDVEDCVDLNVGLYHLNENEMKHIEAKMQRK